MTAPLTLHGLRVVDLSRAVSGPYAGRILADLGAEVVKVEAPEGDLSDQFGRRQGPHSGLYMQMNAGKTAVTVDLHTPDGREAALGLLQHADVVIENFRPGVLDRLGIGFDAISAVNPGVVVLSISGFGASGPEADRRAYAPVIHAESGLLLRNTVDGSSAPPDLPLALADTLAALHGTIAVLAALQLRASTGTGQHIDMSMLEAVVASDDHAHHAIEGESRTMPSRGLIWAAPGGPILIALEMGATWMRLSRTFGLTDSEETRQAPQAEKFAARSRLMAEWIGGFATRAELLAALDVAKIGWADPRSSGQLLTQPTLAARPPYVEVPDGEGGTRPVVRMPYRFSQAADATPTALHRMETEDLDRLVDRWSRTAPEGA
ncbi:MAG TPA: CoA transferase [Acidimicrobiales bacterium]|jgi:CoA:oxalate CoA-transferase|nr:CoA transferase [Acidimicrobiales bacterium]